jgi:hypothetical protein
MKKLTYHLTKDLNIYLFFAVVFAIYQGFRLPSKWSVNYYIPSFFDGIYRRAFLGTILYIFGDLRFNYFFIATIQTIILLLILFAMIKVAMKTNQIKMLYIMYFIAPTGGFLFHEAGYSEQVLYVLLFFALVSRKFGVIIMFLSLFIHEIAFFTTVPVYLAILAYRSENIRKIAFDALILLAGFILVSLFSTFPKSIIDTLINTYQSKANYAIRADFFDIYQYNFTGSRSKCYYGPGHIFEIILSIMFGYRIAGIYAADRYGFERKLLFFLVFSAIFSPIILGFFGNDTSRWFFLSFSAGLFLISIYQKKIEFNSFINLCFILIFFAAYSDFYYFDNFSPRSIHLNKQFVKFIQVDLPNMITDPLDQP